jgi:trigger factor
MLSLDSLNYGPVNVEDVVDGKSDLTFKVIVDLMPEFETSDPAKLTVERITADVSDADVNEALDRLAKNVRNYTTKTAPPPRTMWR